MENKYYVKDVQKYMTLKEMQDERAKHKRLSENYIYWTRQIERLVFAIY